MTSEDFASTHNSYST